MSESLTKRILEAYDGRPFGAKELADTVLCEAAPDLLEALERLLDHCGNACAATGRIHTPESCSICNARTAIARARGYADPDADGQIRPCGARRDDGGEPQAYSDLTPKG